LTRRTTRFPTRLTTRSPSAAPGEGPQVAASLADRAAALLAESDRAAMTLPELARALGATRAELGRWLGDDARFVHVAPPAFPELTILPTVDGASYEAALQRAGVGRAPSVALAEPADPGPGAAVALLLRDSVTRLLARTPDPALVAAAERVRPALAAATSPDPAGTAPSTTRPPDPPEPVRGPPRGRPQPRRRPPYRGSRRG